MKKKRKWPKVVGILFGILILLTIVGLAILPSFILKDMMIGKFAQKVYAPEEYGVEAKTIELTTEDDIRIETYLVEADSPKGTVILISGIHNPSVTAFYGYSRLLKNNGWSSCLVEMRAHGKSDGDMICFGMKEWMDIKAAVDYLKADDTYSKLPIVVWGTSMGASTAINSIGEIDEIDGLISCSAFSAWSDVFLEYMEMSGVPRFLAIMEKPFLNCYLGFKVGFSNMKINAKEEIKKLNGRPALLMHSLEDTQVPYENYERIMKAKKQEVATFVKEGDYHFILDEDLMDDPEKDPEFCNLVLSFLQKNFE